VKDIPIDELSIILSGREGDRLTFLEKADNLPPGPTTFTLFCPVSQIVTLEGLPEFEHIHASVSDGWNLLVIWQLRHDWSTDAAMASCFRGQ
jgi:hypothetical protein